MDKQNYNDIISRYVFDILIQDEYSINHIKDSKLYDISDLDNSLTWDPSILPTIRTHKVNHKLFNTNKEFVNALNHKFIHPVQYYRQINHSIYSDNFCSHFDFTNIIIAGGCISEILMNPEYNIFNNTDIDIFIYGLTQTQAVEKVLYIVKFFKPIKIIIKENYINLMSSDGLKIQIITKLYESINEILYTFDLGSSAVGFDGKRLYFTIMSKFTYETNYNIISEIHESLSYSYRLLKYLKRGFGIIMPFLDISKINTPSIKLPRLFVDLEVINEKDFMYFNVSFDKISFNKINMSMYDDYPIESVIDEDTSTITEANYKIDRYAGINGRRYYNNKISLSVLRLMHNKVPFIQFDISNYENTDESSKLNNNLTKILNINDECYLILKDTATKTITSLPGLYNIKYKIPNSLVEFYSNNYYYYYKTYFNIVPFETIEKNVFSLKNDRSKLREYLTKLCTDQLLATTEKVKNFLDNPICILKWTSRKPDDPIIQPFNPNTDKTSWYGDYLSS